MPCEFDFPGHLRGIVLPLPYHLYVVFFLLHGEFYVMSVMPQTVLVFSFIFKVYDLEAWSGGGIGIGDLEICHLSTTKFSFIQETSQTILTLRCSPS